MTAPGEHRHALEFCVELYRRGDELGVEWMIRSLATTGFPAKIRRAMRDEVIRELDIWLQRECGRTAVYDRAMLLADAGHALLQGGRRTLPNIGRFRDLGAENCALMANRIRPVLRVYKWPSWLQVTRIIEQQVFI